MKYLFILMISNTCMANDYKSACTTALNAAYKQSGAEHEVSQFAINLEQKLVPEEIRPYGAVSYIVYNALASRSISFRWSF